MTMKSSYDMTENIHDYTINKEDKWYTRMTWIIVMLSVNVIIVTTYFITLYSLNFIQLARREGWKLKNVWEAENISDTTLSSRKLIERIDIQ